MIYSEFRFTLDIRALTSQVSLGVKKGETGRRLRIHLTENGYPYHIPDNCYAVFTAKKPDGNKIFNDCVIQDCEIFYDVTEQTVSTTGLLPCAINLYGVEGELLISATFQMIVYSAPVDQSDIESTSEYKALATLIAEAQALKDDMEDGGPGGYYLPEVEQVDDTTLRISFTPSSEEMPAVDPVEVKLPEYSGNDSTQNASAMVSFIDDDCRAATYGTLFPLIQELGIPLTVACPPGELVATDDEAHTYMSVGQLQEMHTYGVEVACHHLKQHNMNTYASAEVYAADLDSCFAKFEEMGITDVNTICYPQGVYVDELMGVVRERFRMGFGVFRGINEPPYESYFMKRCELFPQNGAYTLDDAINLVNDVAAAGGWLIFMTHAYYDTFNADALRDLVAHIHKKGVEIVSVNEAIARTGNTAEAGLFRKPAEDLTAPYFVTDYLGRTFSNGYAAAELSLRTGKVISTTGPVVSVSSGDVEYMVSEKYDITGAESVLVSGWASDGNGLYVFYDDAGNRKEVLYSAKTYAEGGDKLVNKEVKVPAGATQIAIAGHFRQQMPVLKMVSRGSGDGTPGEDGGNVNQGVSVWNGKTASFYGDSITEENHWYTKGYHAWVAELLDLASYNNYGESGADIAIISYRISTKEDNNPNIVFVMAGTNNQHGGDTLGTIDDNTDDTVYGALNNMCTRLKTKYPTSVIVFITPTYQTKWTGAENLTSYEVSKAIKEVCEKYAIPVYDNFTLSGIYKSNISTFSADNCHWNDLTREMVGKNLAKFVADTFRYVYGDTAIGDDTHTHSYTSSVTKAATCDTTGVRTYTCSCGHSYTEAISATGHNYVNGVCSICGAADAGTEIEKTMTGISATYSGGGVAVGTAVTDLTGIVVTAEYSDGSTEEITDYMLIGTIAAGSNAVTVHYEGFTATFTVTGIVSQTVTATVKAADWNKQSIITFLVEVPTGTPTTAKLKLDIDPAERYLNVGTSGAFVYETVEAAYTSAYSHYTGAYTYKITGSHVEISITNINANYPYAAIPVPLDASTVPFTVNLTNVVASVNGSSVPVLAVSTWKGNSNNERADITLS